MPEPQLLAPLVDQAVVSVGARLHEKARWFRQFSAAKPGGEQLHASPLKTPGALQLVKAIEALNPTMEPAKQQGSGDTRLVGLRFDVER